MEQITVPVNFTLEVDTHKQHEIARACLSLTRFIAESTAFKALLSDNGFKVSAISVGQATRVIKPDTIAELREHLEANVKKSLLADSLYELAHEYGGGMSDIYSQLEFLMQQGLTYRGICNEIGVTPQENWI